MPEERCTKRKSAPKGRTGCSTCKSRHVRCDEHKPRCTPCQKSSRMCEYSVPTSRPYPNQLKVVLWQPSGISIRRVSSHPGQNYDEGRYLEFFRIKVALDLGGFFDSSFWNHDVLQAAQHEPSILHAVVALASLSETSMQEKQEREHDDQTESSKGIDRNHSISRSVSPHGFAIEQKIKAISALIQSIQNSRNKPPEVVLISCVIFTCIEMLQNNYESALCQMTSGILVFFDWLSKQGHTDAAACPRDSPGAFLVNLRPVFERLMLQVIMFVDTKPQGWHFIRPALLPSMPSMPVTFESLADARNCLNTNLCYMSYRATVSQFCGLEGLQVEADFFDRWSRLFEKFIADQGTQMSSKEQHATYLLEMQHKTGYILISVGAFPQETIFDSFEDSFAGVVELASTIVASLHGHDQDSTCPAFDMGILPVLYFVASRCRNPTIRRQALHLLRTGRRQEGIWHSGMLSNIAERIMTLEESDCVEPHSSKDIPANARLAVLNATIDSKKRSVALHCGRQESVSSERTEVLHEWIEY